MTDRQIVAAIIGRDQRVTKNYLYKQCFPLFNSIFKRYHTDCASTIEFISEIYVLLLSPGPQSGRSRLEQFGFRCSLTMWLKIVAENHCRQLYSKKLETAELFFDPGDRLESADDSLEINQTNLNVSDVEKILMMMPNERYRQIIRLRYLEEMSNEETANLLGMSKDNFYNKHRLAKQQFETMLRKEASA